MHVERVRRYRYMCTRHVFATNVLPSERSGELIMTKVTMTMMMTMMMMIMTMMMVINDYDDDHDHVYE